MSKLTILSFGGGQDSTALLYKLVHEPNFRKQYAPEDLWVVMADTYNEHTETYKNVIICRRLCEDNGIPFFLLDPKTWAPKSWKGGLVKFYEADSRIGSKAFPKTCTDNLKIKPIYNFVDQKIHEVYGTLKVGRKAAIKEFVRRWGRINVIIGIAFGEEVRASTNEESPQKWMRECVNKSYPLISLKLDRAGCQKVIENLGGVVPPPSNCILCPFMSEQELLYLYLKMPHWYDKWVELEQNKIDRFGIKGNLSKTLNRKGEMVDNMGVWGVKLLPEKLVEAKKKFGHMTMEDLQEYKMSHGHCVKSKY